MYRNTTFCQRFRTVLILTSFTGLHIPQVDHPRCPLFRLLTFLAITTQCIFCCDMIYIFFTQEMPALMAFFVLFVFTCYFWTLMKNIYFLSYRKQLADVFKVWTDELHTFLWPHKREEANDKAIGTTVTNIAISASILILPYIVMGAWKVFYSGTLFLATSFNGDPFSQQAPTYLILFQTLCICLNVGNCVTYPAFVLHMMNVVEAELDYLEYCLQHIFMDLKVNESGHIENRIPNAGEMVRENLREWIKYHGRVMQFQESVKLYISMPVFGEYIFLIINLCGLLYCTISGILGAELAIYCIAYDGIYFYQTYRLCSAGDSIMKKSSRITNAAFFKDWMAYPTDVQNALRFICLVSQKSLAFTTRGLFALSSPTFKQLTFVQYRLLRFMKDMR